MKKTILAIIGLLIISCNSDDTTTPPIVLDITDFNLVVSDVNENSAFIDLNYTVVEISGGTVEKKVLYKKSGDVDWIENEVGLLDNLENGISYEVKGLVLLEDQSKETPIVTFTTPAFEIGENYSTGMYAVNRRYRVQFFTDTDLNNAPTLSGYMVMNNDSLALKNITIIDAKTFEVELPENTQFFFENDSEYVHIKSFSLGIFSGDFYTKITDNAKLRIFNKLPNITNVRSLLIDDCTSGSEYWDIRFNGQFWATENGFYDNLNDLYNNPKKVQLDIINTDTNAQESTLLSIVPDDFCDTSQWFQFVELIHDDWFFHGNSLMIVKLDKIIFTAGNYAVRIYITDQDNVIFESNTLNFKLE